MGHVVRRVVPHAGVAALLLLTACGSSSGAPPAQDQLLAGDYQYVSLRVTPYTPYLRSETGACEADGGGRLTFADAYEAEEGLVTGPYTPSPRVYSVATDRTLAVTDKVRSTLRGRLSGDGSFAALSARTDGDSPTLMFLLRRDAEPTAAELAGTWHLVRIHRSPNPAFFGYGAVGKITVDGGGGISFTEYTFNRDGDIDPTSILQVPLELVPASDGTVHWRHAVTTDLRMRGGLSEDGDMVLLGPTEAWVGYAGVQILIRESQGAALADVQGTWGSAGYTMLTSVMMWGPWQLDGAGGGAYDPSVNTHMSVTNEPAFDLLGYSVGTDGGTDVTLPFGVLRGAVDPARRCLVLGGTLTAGGPVWFQVLVR